MYPVSVTKCDKLDLLLSLLDIRRSHDICPALEPGTEKNTKNTNSDGRNVQQLISRQAHEAKVGNNGRKVPIEGGEGKIHEGLAEHKTVDSGTPEGVPRLFPIEVFLTRSRCVQRQTGLDELLFSLSEPRLAARRLGQVGQNPKDEATEYYCKEALKDKYPSPSA